MLIWGILALDGRPPAGHASLLGSFGVQSGDQLLVQLLQKCWPLAGTALTWLPILCLILLRLPAALCLSMSQVLPGCKSAGAAGFFMLTALLQVLEAAIDAWQLCTPGRLLQLSAY